MGVRHSNGFARANGFKLTQLAQQLNIRFNGNQLLLVKLLLVFSFLGKLIQFLVKRLKPI